ncbi:surface lipoprotein assembly modifier [Altericroceibacterium xinjiangense]|uniref:surface lipoprotein assembly modifier n=1 Tax=Altericroceibacterium xinjiangense TaxID=762261 RepID=UPI000F7F457F|nr:surface lipoprotein assembly modifier [Altericroceibacterium xinjiangense]
MAVEARAQQQLENLRATDLFALAAEAAAKGQSDDPLTLYNALSRDPDIEIRTEARFRKGQLLESLGRPADAALEYRAILDAKPDATRVRLELARMLVLLGDERGARRALRQAQAAELPPDTAALIDQFAASLRSRRPFGGSVQVGLAPDTNINRATSARTLETIIAPLTLSEDARGQSGVGLLAAGQAYARVSVAPDLSIVPRVSGRGAFYRESAFNDISGSALLGLEWQLGNDRLTPSAGRTWRWYGDNLLATTDTVTLTWIRPVNRRMQVIASGSAAYADYKQNRLQSGGLYDLSATLEYALDQRSGIGTTLSGTRQDAADPGYATTSGGFVLYGWREAGRTTVFATVGARRTAGDERLFLFLEPRREWLLQASAGATLRQFTWQGFAPTVRAGIERNVSNVGLYDYRRFNTEFGITRAF